jgi:hypothetical protein
MTSPHNPQFFVAANGFALLITIVIISVVLAVGISLLNITVKQINLSITGRDSEVAFHAAQGGVECVQQLLNETDYISGAPLSGPVACLGNSSPLNTGISGDGVNNSNVYEYQFEVSWNNGDLDVCTQTDIYLFDATSGALSETFTNQGIVTFNCAAGEYCVAVFSRGYNRACTQLNSLRTVQREITITL